MTTHQVFGADGHRVPPPFRAFAVRSDEARHAGLARAPWGQVHVLRTTFLDPASCAALAAHGQADAPVQGFSDVNYARTTWAALATAAPAVQDLPRHIAAALQHTGVLGTTPGRYRRSVLGRIDYLSARGAGFHNDVARHWPRCLFWLLALVVDDVAFVMPHAGLQVLLRPGDLLVFDQTMAHGLCRPADGGQALAASFEGERATPQVFLTGELRLSDVQWAALGAPWLPLEEHRGALDLRLALFDERTGAIQRLGALQGGMQRG
ncbi:MAG: hypothetical protein IV093_17730 [Rubrivivax sp.]|nr:hypothetical protein [Rubrivivax sp.]